MKEAIEKNLDSVYAAFELECSRLEMSEDERKLIIRQVVTLTEGYAYALGTVWGQMPDRPKQELG